MILEIQRTTGCCLLCEAAGSTNSNVEVSASQSPSHDRDTFTQMQIVLRNWNLKFIYYERNMLEEGLPLEKKVDVCHGRHSLRLTWRHE